MVDRMVLQQLLALAANEGTSGQAQAIAQLKIDELDKWLADRMQSTLDIPQKAHLHFGRTEIARFMDNPASWKAPAGC